MAKLRSAVPRKFIRTQVGIQLVEMVIAVALSGVFVVLLTGMLAQTMSLSVASQNQIIAGAIADELVEQIQSGYLTSGVSVSFPESATTGRLQLDPANESYGTFLNGTFDPSRQWTVASGNQFKGNVQVTVTGTNPRIFTVVVNYPVDGGTKTISRFACQWTNGAF